MTDFTIPIILLFLFLCSLKIDIIRMKKHFLKDENQHMRDLVNENKQLRKALDEADDLIKSHLSSHYNRKWENYLEYLGVDLE